MSYIQSVIKSETIATKMTFKLMKLSVFVLVLTPPNYKLFTSMIVNNDC